MCEIRTILDLNQLDFHISEFPFSIQPDRGFPKADRLWLCQDLGPLHADAPQLMQGTQGPFKL